MLKESKNVLIKERKEEETNMTEQKQEQQVNLTDAKQEELRDEILNSFSHFTEDEQLELQKRRDLFRSFNLKYRIKALRYCADNNIDFSQLVATTPRNILLLLTIGNEEHSDTVANDILEQWLDAGYSFQVLHFLCIEQARKSGFFMNDQDKSALALAGRENPNNSALLMNLAQSELMKEIQAIASIQSIQ